MQVWFGGIAGVSHFADSVARSHAVAGPDGDRRLSQMSQLDEFMSVVDDDVIPRHVSEVEDTVS